MFKRRQKRVKFNSQSIEPNHVESYKPKSIKLAEMWLPELEFKQSDKEILLSYTTWLNDDIINAAQKLLKKENPAVLGLKDVVCGLTMNFDVEPGEFVQILHTGHGHWNTVSTIGMRHSEVQIFDSMYMCVPTMAKAEIAGLLNTEEASITVNFMDVIVANRPGMAGTVPEFWTLSRWCPGGIPELTRTLRFGFHSVRWPLQSQSRLV